VTLPYVAPNIGAGHTYHQFTVRTPHRNALQAHLKANGIDSGIYYPLSLHLQEAYAFLGYRVGDFPVSERVTEEVLSLPIHPDLTNEQIGYVAEQIYAFDRLPAAV
jgi:dTDP-4-amino-4,6-dideoxygalactose transaminase